MFEKCDNATRPFPTQRRALQESLPDETANPTSENSPDDSPVSLPDLQDDLKEPLDEIATPKPDQSSEPTS